MSPRARNPSGPFKTYANHLCAFASIAAGNASKRTDALRNAQERARASGFLPSARCQNANLEQAQSSLQHAWGTELLMVMSERFLDADEMVRLSNNWSVVQAYYVIYHATQAMVVANGNQRPETHQKTQKQFYSLFAGRGFGLEPWTMAFGHGGPLNVPPNMSVDDGVHSWTSCSATNRWNLAFKALRTARNDTLPAQEQDARERKRNQKRNLWRTEEHSRISAGRKPRREPAFQLMRLTADEKEAVRRTHRPFTLIDFLYRLRIRTNYEDSSMFTDGPDRVGQSEAVRNDLHELVATSLLVAELHIRPLVGATQFDNWVSTWINANARFNPPSGVAERTPFHAIPPVTQMATVI